MPCSVASDLGLHWLPITILGVFRLQWATIRKAFIFYYYFKSFHKQKQFQSTILFSGNPPLNVKPPLSYMQTVMTQTSLIMVAVLCIFRYPIVPDKALFQKKKKKNGNLLISPQKHVAGIHYKCHTMALLMSTHNICCHEVISNILLIPGYPSYLELWIT